MGMSKGVQELLLRYVEEIEKALSRRGRVSEPVREALLTVERHRFLEGFYRDETGAMVWVDLNPEDPSRELLESHVYVNKPLLVKLSPDGMPLSSSSAPSLVATMIELLGLEKGMNLLEIGTGTGYNAALMAEIVGDSGQVTTLEIQADVAERTARLLRKAGYGGIQLRCADGFHGWPENAPYDRIVATTCCADISPHWLEQLGEEGWLLVPLQHGDEWCAPLTRIGKDGRARVLEFAGFGSAQGMLYDSAWPWVPGAKATQCSKPKPADHGRLLIRLPEGGPDRYDLHYFLALQSPLACLEGTKDCVGILWDDDEEDIAWLSRDETGWFRLMGSDKVYRAAKEWVTAYEDIGCPRVQDYQMEFTVRHKAREQATAMPFVRPTGPREWVVERRFTIQRVWLPR